MDLIKLEVKLDKLDERLDSIDKTLLLQHAALEEHIRGVRAAETNIGLLRDQLRPIQKHVSQLEGALKLLGLLSVVAGLAYQIYQIIRGQ